MTRSDEVSEIAKALAGAQAAMASAKLGAENPAFKRGGKASKYATLADIWDACREPLTSHGLSVVQTVARDEGGVQVETLLLHTSGQWISDMLAMPLDSRANAQAVGSAITYGRRYALAAFVGVAPADDDDGNAAAGSPPPPDVEPKPRSTQRRTAAAKGNGQPPSDEYELLKARTFALLAEHKERTGVSQKDATAAAGLTPGKKPTLVQLEQLREYLEERLAMAEAGGTTLPEVAADELPEWMGGKAPDRPVEDGGAE